MPRNDRRLERVDCVSLVVHSGVMPDGFNIHHGMLIMTTRTEDVLEPKVAVPIRS